MTRDNPLHRIEIREMSNDELDIHLTQIRERRLEPIRVYEEAQALKKRLVEAKLIAKLDKTFQMFSKEQAAVEKAIAKLEARALKIKALKLEIEEVSGEEDASQRDRGDSEERERPAELIEGDALRVRHDEDAGKATAGDGSADGSDGKLDGQLRAGGGQHEEHGRPDAKEDGGEHRERGPGRSTQVKYKCGKCGEPVPTRFSPCIRC